MGLKKFEVWFITENHHLYGPETLYQVAQNSGQIADELNQAHNIPVQVIFNPVLTTPEAVYERCPNLKVAAAAWILAGGVHHTGLNLSVTTESLQDFAEMAGLEFLLIDQKTKLDDFKKELRWNDLYYSHSKK